MTLFLLIVLALVAFLYLLIVSIVHGEHFAPQAYYRSKRVGAPVALARDRLGPRPRKRLPLETAATGGQAPGGQAVSSAASSSNTCT